MAPLSSKAVEITGMVGHPLQTLASHLSTKSHKALLSPKRLSNDGSGPVVGSTLHVRISGFPTMALKLSSCALRDAKVTGVPWKVGCAADFGFGGDGADCIGTAVAVGLDHWQAVLAEGWFAGGIAPHLQAYSLYAAGLHPAWSGAGAPAESLQTQPLDCLWDVVVGP